MKDRDVIKNAKEAYRRLAPIKAHLLPAIKQIMPLYEQLEKESFETGFLAGAQWAMDHLSELVGLVEAKG